MNGHQRYITPCFKKNLFNNFETCEEIISECKNIINKNNLENYIFLHIRRGDYLYNKKLAPPYGSCKYTSSIYIKNFLDKKKK
tara:strand:+ start:2912 stop:3160 length:249 start_codon:yes stop_codon:yes gene_type:complete